MASGNHSKGQVRLVSLDICEQIDLVKQSLVKDSRFDLVRQHRTYRSLRTEAARYSVAIEVPDAHGSKKKVRAGRARKIAEGNLTSAQDYFADHYSGRLYSQLIMDAALLLEPSLGFVAGYRSGDGPMTCPAGYVLIYPDDVADQMDLFIPENNALSIPVERAIHAHFHIARIHPFRDGNGRLARLVQNGILGHHGLPPIIISSDERKDYLQLIYLAQRSYKDAGEGKVITALQSRFYNYLALKLRDSLLEAKKLLAK